MTPSSGTLINLRVVEYLIAKIRLIIEIFEQFGIYKMTGNSLFFTFSRDYYDEWDTWN